LYVLEFFPFIPTIKKNAKPLLISGFRAGALRHPTEDLLSESI
jgi:hypothetical protein